MCHHACVGSWVKHEWAPTLKEMVAVAGVVCDVGPPKNEFRKLFQGRGGRGSTGDAGGEAGDAGGGGFSPETQRCWDLLSDGRDPRAWYSAVSFQNEEQSVRLLSSLTNVFGFDVRGAENLPRTARAVREQLANQLWRRAPLNYGFFEEENTELWALRSQKELAKKLFGRHGAAVEAGEMLELSRWRVRKDGKRQAGAKRHWYYAYRAKMARQSSNIKRASVSSDVRLLDDSEDVVAEDGAVRSRTDAIPAGVLRTTGIEDFYHGFPTEKATLIRFSKRSPFVKRTQKPKRGVPWPMTEDGENHTIDSIAANAIGVFCASVPFVTGGVGALADERNSFRPSWNAWSPGGGDSASTQQVMMRPPSCSIITVYRAGPLLAGGHCNILTTVCVAGCIMS